MKPGYAAALALVGWYLMVPPARTVGGNMLVASHAPMRGWMRIGKSFDSLTDCEKAREKTQKNVQNAKEAALENAANMDANPSNQDLAGYEAAREIKCMSNDDPRIKGRGISVSPAWSRFLPAK